MTAIMEQPSYRILRTSKPPELQGRWDGETWGQAMTLDIACFRPESSDHRPVTNARLFYDEKRIYVIFRVHDRYIRCLYTRYLDPVYQDSCVEWFVQPQSELGYFNFEINCGGALLCYYIEDPTRDEQRRLKKYRKIPVELVQQIAIYHSLPVIVDPEITDFREWVIEFSVPLTLFEYFVGSIGMLAGQNWRGNFYKCGNATSHPHWASWAPLGAYNFHRPEDFAPITLT
jgi:hypothetical protein